MTQIRNLTNSIEECGLTVPPELERLADLEDGFTSAVHWGGPAGTDPETELIAALDRMTTRQEAAEALRHAGIEQAATKDTRYLHGRVARELRKKLTQAVVEAGPDLVAQARPAFDAAVTEMAEVVRVLGEPNPDPAALANSGTAEQLEVYRTRRADAIHTLRRSAEVLVVLAAEGYRIDGDHRAWWVVDPSIELDELDRAVEIWDDASDQGIDHYSALLAAGIPLHLNDHTEALALQSRIAERDAARAEAEKAAEAQARQDTPEMQRERALADAWTRGGSA
jgi:hypothetical protein